MADAAMSSPASDPRGALHALIAQRSFRTDRVFTLASGKQSNIYFNLKPAMMPATGADHMAELMHALIAPYRPDLVGGLEMGAVPIVSAVSIKSVEAGRPIDGFFVRKKAKEHGAALLLEGLAEGESLAGKRAAIIDDVATTGGSALKAAEAVRAAGGEVAVAAVVVDRQEGATQLFAEHGIPLASLFTADDFLPEGFERMPPKVG